MNLESFLDRVLNLKKKEGSYAVLAFLLFFCIFCSYSVLRPVRDTMGITSGVDSLQWLFTATFVVSITVQIPYFYVLGKISRKIILPVIFSFFGANLLFFAYLIAHEIAPVTTGRTFYVWLSVYNLAVISLGWSVLNDILKPSQSKRLFAIAASGSSAGSIIGPMITATAVKYTGFFPLILISLAFLAMASLTVYYLFSIRSEQCNTDESAQIVNNYLERRINGSILEGFLSTFKSRYLLMIAFFVILASTANTFLYFAQVKIIADSFADKSEQTFVFSVIDLIVNTATIILQLFITGRLAENFGLKPLIAVVPVLILICFVVLIFIPVLSVIVMAMIVRRVGEYALVRPGKEMLFSVVSLDEKYKSKNFIDTVIYRGGDVFSAFLTQGAEALGGVILSFATGAIMAIVWIINALYLSKLFNHKSQEKL